MSTNKRDMYVIPRDDGGWSVERRNSTRASSVHDTQRKAEARRLARQDQVEFNLHGRIREKDSYGNDSHPPRG